MLAEIKHFAVDILWNQLTYLEPASSRFLWTLHNENSVVIGRLALELWVERTETFYLTFTYQIRTNRDSNV